MSSSTKKANTTIRNEKLFCLNCGDEHPIGYPISIPDFTKKTEEFNKRHKSCKPTWKEPEANQDQSILQRAAWWAANGETGMSSKTMWKCMMNQTDFEVNHPHDPADFKRCYKLLQAVPEWKTQLHRLKELSPAWSNLVDHWDELTEMFEKNEREDWENYKEIGMYELMEKLTNNR